MRGNLCLVISFTLAACLLASIAAAPPVCTRDGQWGEGHQYRCLDDNTYDVCKLDGSAYDHVNICKYVCSADLACNGLAPYTELLTCTQFGKSYLQDFCDANCDLKDDACESSYAGCTADSQCDEKNPGENGCDNQCKYHFCGDNVIDAGEQCELPSTQNNNHCSQTSQTCSGHKKGVRDSFGNCNSNCLCSFDSFSYQCVAGACGAECSVNADCNDGDPNTIDTCSEDCQCVQEPVCGNDVINPGEECELPSTPNNAYCPQSSQSCLGKKLGTRDSFGNCDVSCQCILDQLNYQCVKGQCGAECSNNADCDDQDSNTVDTCLADCTCQHTPIHYCGNSKVEAPEQCELPNTFNNHFCQQSMTQCNAKKIGIRDAYGDCGSNCGCTNDSFSYMCIKDVCGAECSSDADCNDQNPYTTDTCLSSCVCSHQQLPYCGNGQLDSGEQCELPNTNNNNYCTQTTSQCAGNMLGTRDSFGSCNSGCGCVQDQFNYQCSLQCGAQCATNSDCNDQNPNTIDTCNQNCTCSHVTQPYCGDGTVGAGEQCELPNTNNNNYCGQTNETCIGNKLATRDHFGFCSSQCSCVPDSFCPGVCVKGKCGAQCSINADCDDANPLTTDTCLSNCTCEHTPTTPECGNGYVEAGEQCELPTTSTNQYCAQTNETCNANKFGIRAKFGDCSSQCQCSYNTFTYSCNKHKCGAQCEANDDCSIGACKAVFDDYCCAKKLADYNGNHLLDNLTVSNTCNNTCLGSCACTSCQADCSPPQPSVFCVKGICGANCAADSDCTATDCHHLNGCHGNDYYEYADVANTCNQCTCTSNQCDGPIIHHNDPRCTQCQTDSNCTSLNRDYCGGSLVKHDLGKCINYTCTVQTTTVTNCSTLDNDYCFNNTIKHDSYTCSNAACVLDKSTIKQHCDDGIFCNGEESCASAQCMQGTAVDCSSHNINVSVCDYVPDNITATFDSFSFMSSCNENTDSCTTAPINWKQLITHTCSISKCGAQCESDSNCGPSACSATYNDFCNASKLVDYNDNKHNDSVFVADSCNNTCQQACSCTQCTPDCPTPLPTTHCVEGLCGATCEDNAQCTPNSCTATYNDSCSGKRLVEYNNNNKKDFTVVTDSCDNSCTGSCSCSNCQTNCAAPPQNSHCVSGVCGAQCTTSADCDDDNYRTVDNCTSGCVCSHKCAPGYFVVPNGIGILICMNTEDFPPQIWQCDSRIILDDNVAFGPGGPGSPIIERVSNYAFEGEKIHWKVLVFDKNGIDKVKDVYMTVGEQQGTGNNIEANCQFAEYLHKGDIINKTCNARILEENLTTVPSDDTMAYYDCTFTVEPASSMYGEYFITAEAQDLTGLIGIMKENEYWFLNPTVALSIQGSVDFGTIRPGSAAYADTISIGNDAEPSSGLNMNMFISGTDFYDAGHSGAKCPTTNQLTLDHFRYFATNGGYSTFLNPTSDSEGYDTIPYGNKLFKAKSIIGAAPYPANTPYQIGNVLTPGAEMSVTMRLDVPEPCLGNFNDGQIYFWGEAI